MPAQFINSLFKKWAKQPLAVQVVTSPAILLLSLINIVAFISIIVWATVIPRRPVEVKLLSREELLDQSANIEQRFESIFEQNSLNGSEETLDPFRDQNLTVAKAIRQTVIDHRVLKTQCDDFLAQHNKAHGTVISDVRVLCLHVSRWCEEHSDE